MSGTALGGRGAYVIIFVLVGLIAFLGIQRGCASMQGKRETPVRPGMTPLSIDGNTVAWAEIARDENTRRTGLMHRTRLEEDCGMLFIDKEERLQSFWMKNCLIDLDIAYIASDGTIQEILLMKAEPPGALYFPSYPSAEPGKYALEMSAGWFARKGLKAGTRFDRCAGAWGNPLADRGKE